MAEIEKKTKRYPTDLTDEEWERIEPLLPSPREAGRKPRRRFARGAERDPLHGALGLRLADAAEGFSALADGLLVVPALCAALPVPDHPRRGADARPRARGPRGEPDRGRHRQPVGQGAGGAKRGVTTPARRSSAASATSRSTPTAGC